MLQKLKKNKTIINKFGKNDLDTGDSKVQIALLTERINYLQKHFSMHKRDYSSRRGLIKMVSYRRKLLNYLKNKKLSQYNFIVNELSLRR